MKIKTDNKDKTIKQRAEVLRDSLDRKPYRIYREDLNYYIKQIYMNDLIEMNKEKKMKPIDKIDYLIANDCLKQGWEEVSLEGFREYMEFSCPYLNVVKVLIFREKHKENVDPQKKPNEYALSQTPYFLNCKVRNKILYEQEHNNKSFTVEDLEKGYYDLFLFMFKEENMSDDYYYTRYTELYARLAESRVKYYLDSIHEKDPLLCGIIDEKEPRVYLYAKPEDLINGIPSDEKKLFKRKF